MKTFLTFEFNKYFILNLKTLQNAKQKIKFNHFCSAVSKNFCKKIERLDFKKIDNNDIEFFNSILGKLAVMSTFNDKSLSLKDLNHFNIDYMKIYQGNSNTVLFPSKAEHVVEIMKYCNKNKIAVCPQSGNTGLVGGSTPVHDEVIINMSKFNKIISFDDLTGTVHCESGVILENLNQYLKDYNHTPPVDLGAKGSCMIGGNISTNAGGIHFIKFGSLRQNLKGLKAVLASGEIIDCMNPLPKNNTGYDLKQMFCGSEGTLGVITECLLNCFPIPKFTNIALLKLNSFGKILQTYSHARKELGESLYAMEFWDTESMYLQVKSNNKINPFDENKQDDYSKLLIIL